MAPYLRMPSTPRTNPTVPPMAPPGEPRVRRIPNTRMSRTAVPTHHREQRTAVSSTPAWIFRHRRRTSRTVSVPATTEPNTPSCSSSRRPNTLRCDGGVGKPVRPRHSRKETRKTDGNALRGQVCQCLPLKMDHCFYCLEASLDGAYKTATMNSPLRDPP